MNSRGFLGSTTSKVGWGLDLSRDEKVCRRFHLIQACWVDMREGHQSVEPTDPESTLKGQHGPCWLEVETSDLCPAQFPLWFSPSWLSCHELS